MWMVERVAIGAIAYGRMQRDGVIRTVVPGFALPEDVPDSPALRRWALRQCFPTYCQLTGLGVLWAHGHADRPTHLDIRTTPGRHVRHWRGPLPLVFHSAGVFDEPAPAGRTDPPTDNPDRDLAFAPLAVSIADALRWSPLHVAIPASMSALEAHGSAAFRTGVAGHVAGHRRAQSAWEAIDSAMTAVSAPDQEGRLAPVMRRAS